MGWTKEEDEGTGGGGQVELGPSPPCRPASSSRSHSCAIPGLRRRRRADGGSQEDHESLSPCRTRWFRSDERARGRRNGGRGQLGSRTTGRPTDPLQQPHARTPLDQDRKGECRTIDEGATHTRSFTGLMPSVWRSKKTGSRGGFGSDVVDVESDITVRC